MDPDIPIPSVEKNSPPLDAVINNRTGHQSLQRQSPEKTPFRTPPSHQPSPSPLKIPKSSSRSSTPSHERNKTPVLQTKRSISNLSTARNMTPSRLQSRRPSSNLNPLSTSPGASSDMIGSEVVTLTPALVAKEYFERELKYHGTISNKIMVIMHDSCYGHRFSRPRTSKAALSTIVERPERLHATLLGASAAYVRLGDRHAAGQYGPHPDRDPSAASEPPFIVRRTTRSLDLNHPAVTNVHGTKWMEELQIMCDSAEAKLAMNGKELTRPIGYGKDEAGNALPKLHEGDLYLSSQSLAALQGCLGGVCDAVDAVFSSDATQRAFVNIRPPGHHCSSNFPSGFCWLNNVHVGISYAAMNHNLTHAAIIDFDLHHGDGSQSVTWEHNQKAQNLPKNAAAHRKVPIGYYSLHDINSYPCEWGDEEKVRNASLCLQNAHGQSIWNVHLEPWESLDHFWKLYEAKYKVLLDKTRGFLKTHSEKLRQAGIKPRAAIFLSAGFDASEWESAGMQRHSVNVPTEFYARFTSDTVRLAEEETLGVDGRVISVLEGGYSDRALASGVLSHLCGLTNDTDDSHSATSTMTPGVARSPRTYDTAWWSQHHLEAMEAIVIGHAPPPPPKASKQPGNYSSPTQASTMKMTETARERQSLSAQLEARLSLGNVVVEPPPEVDWVTATYELSRILIPSDRQTLSCRHDELNAEATRARRERQSMLGLPTVADQKMQLRDRRAKPMPPIFDGPRPASRSANRRTTIAGVNELPDHSAAEPVPDGRPRRRSSAASSILSSFQGMKLEDGGVDVPSTKVVNEVSDLVKGQAVLERQQPLFPKNQTASRTSSRDRGTTQNTSNIHMPTVTNTTTAGKAASTVPGSRSNSRSRRSSMGSEPINNGIDDLTNGMKKVSIRLNMPKQEQHATDREKTEGEKLPKGKTVRKTAIPRTTKAKTTAATKTMPKPRGSKAVAATAIMPAIPADSGILAPQSDLLAGNTSTTTHLAEKMQPHVTQAEQSQPSMLTATNMDVSAQAKADNSEEVASVQTSQPKDATAPSGQIIPEPEKPIISIPQVEKPPPRPDAPTPATMLQSQGTPVQRKRDDLPVFTATSPIPFANPAPGQATFDQNKENTTQSLNKSIWDIPDTPRG